MTIPAKWAKGEARALIDAAIPVYQGYYATSNAAQAAPAGRDWPKVMAGYLADPALTQWVVASYKPLVEHDLHIVGYRTATATITNVVTRAAAGGVQGVQMAACVGGKGALVDKDGRQVNPFPSARVKVIITVEKLPSGWRSRSVTSTFDGKTVKC